MASFPARIIDELILRPLEQLLSTPQPVKLRLDTGRRLANVVVITDPAEHTRWFPVTAGQEYRYESPSNASITVAYLDYYDQSGVKIIRLAVWKVLHLGDVFTFRVPETVSAT